MRQLLLLILFCTVPIFAASLSLENDLEVKLLITQEGDTLSVTALYGREDTLFLYAESQRELLILSHQGNLLQRVPMETIGRNGYLGDCFVVQGDTVRFLNSVDKRIENFELETGLHAGALSFPDLFAEEEELQRRLVFQVALVNNELYLGNRYRFKKISKRYGSEPVKSTCDSCRVLYLDSEGMLTVDSLGAAIENSEGRKRTEVQLETSPFICRLNGVLQAVTISADSVSWSPIR